MTMNEDRESVESRRKKVKGLGRQGVHRNQPVTEVRRARAVQIVRFAAF